MKKFLLPSILCAFVVSCASNPTSRIQKNPDKFASLSPSDQQLVQRGEIDEGMSKDAVFLAYGKPDVVKQTLNNGLKLEEWGYYSLEPVYRHRLSIGIGIGNGYGYYGRRNRSNVWYGPSIDYVPRVSAVIQFQDDYVHGYRIQNR